MRDGDDCGAVSGRDEWSGNPKNSEKTWPRAAFPITDPVCLELASNTSSHGRALMTNFVTCRKAHSTSYSDVSYMTVVCNMYGKKFKTVHILKFSC
jgi:hypothetical protein